VCVCVCVCVLSVCVCELCDFYYTHAYTHTRLDDSKANREELATILKQMNTEYADIAREVCVLCVCVHVYVHVPEMEVLYYV